MLAGIDFQAVKAELEKAVSLLETQGYASEYSVKIGLDVGGRSSFLRAALRDHGWEGDATFHGTNCGNEGVIYSVFDANELTISIVDALVRDEAEHESRN